MNDKRKKTHWFQKFICCNSRPLKVQSLQKIPDPSIPMSFKQLCQQQPVELDKVQYLKYDQAYNVYSDVNKRIITQTQLSDLMICDLKPTEDYHQNSLKYSCPICFRFFNYMLKANCCQNYICHLCCLSFIQNIKNSCCHFCRTDHSVFIDVMQCDQMKFYSDSQGMQQFSRKTASEKIIIKSVHQESRVTEKGEQ